MTPGKTSTSATGELHAQVCRLANALRARGVGKGDRVCIYMPMIPEAAYAMLACTRIGAIHSVVFGGFSPEALKDRILDSDCQTVITADEGVRGGKTVPLKTNVDTGPGTLPQRTHLPGGQAHRRERRLDRGPRDTWYHELTAGQEDTCTPESNGRGRPAVYPLHLGLHR